MNMVCFPCSPPSTRNPPLPPPSKPPNTQHTRHPPHAHLSLTPTPNAHTQTSTGFFGAWAIPGVTVYAFTLFFSKLVAYTFLYWLPYYINATEIGSRHLTPTVRARMRRAAGAQTLPGVSACCRACSGGIFNPPTPALCRMRAGGGTAVHPV